MIEPFGEDWVDALVEATSNRSSAGGLGGHVTIKANRKKVTLVFEDGSVMGTDDEVSTTVLPFKGDQYEAWLAGELNLAEAYTRGDLRAEGPTGPLLAAIEVFDDPLIRQALA